MSADTYKFESPEAVAMLDKIRLLVEQQQPGDGRGLSRYQVAHDTGMTADTAYLYCKKLQQQGLIHCKRHQRGSGWFPGPNPAPTAKQIARAASGTLSKLDKPRRKTVKKWPANQVRDPYALSADFFRKTGEQQHG